MTEETFDLETMTLVVRYAKAQRLRWALYGFIAGVLITEGLLSRGWVR